jgi:hypothetical protein
MVRWGSQFLLFNENNEMKTQHYTDMQFSQHASQRAQQRAIDPLVITEIIRHGERIYKQGIIFHFMPKNSLRLFYHRTDQKQIEDVVVITSHDGTVITAYRNQHAVKSIKRKSKRLCKKPKFAELNGRIAHDHVFSGACAA